MNNKLKAKHKEALAKIQGSEVKIKVKEAKVKVSGINIDLSDSSQDSMHDKNASNFSQA